MLIVCMETHLFLYSFLSISSIPGFAFAFILTSCTYNNTTCCHTSINAACLNFLPQADATPPCAASPTNGSGAAPHSNGRGIFTVTDSMDQPKLKGQGRMKRTRFSIRRHLQKHGLAQADSDSDLENEDSE